MGIHVSLSADTHGRTHTLIRKHKPILASCPKIQLYEKKTKMVKCEMMFLLIIPKYPNASLVQIFDHYTIFRHGIKSR